MFIANFNWPTLQLVILGKKYMIHIKLMFQVSYKTLYNNENHIVPNYNSNYDRWKRINHNLSKAHENNAFSQTHRFHGITTGVAVFIETNKNILLLCFYEDNTNGSFKSTIIIVRL